MLVLCCLSFLFLFALYAQETLPAVAQAANQFLYSVLPSLLPFYVTSELLLRTKFCERLGRLCRPWLSPLFGLSGPASFAIFVGMISGYPAGAKASVDLYKAGWITKEEACHLSAFTNNTGPLFLIGAVGAGMLHSVRAGLLLWVLHILSALLVGLFFRSTGIKRLPRDSSSKNSSPAPVQSIRTAPMPESHKSFGQLLSEAITSSTYTMIPIAGAILFFAAFNAVLVQCGLYPFLASRLDSLGLGPIFSGILPGIVEITGGISILSTLRITKAMELTSIAFVAGWAGISVHIQVVGILSQAGLSCRSYLVGKFLHASLAAVITGTVFFLFPQWFCL